MGSLGKSIDRVFSVGVTAAIAGATLAVGAFVASTVKIGAAFEKEVAILGSIRGVTKASAEGEKELGKFEAKARELGASTAYSATEAVIGMQQLARAGMQTNEVISAVGPALMFAGASASDMNSATTLLASSMKQFSLASSDASRISDAFTVIQQQSLFDMTSLADAMKYAGTTGSAFGWSIEQTTASVALFRDLGLEGASAGTQFRMAMQKLGKPTSAAEKVLDKYNIKLQDVNPSLNSFDEIASRLAKKNLTFPELTTLFGARAAGSMSKIIEQFGTGSEKYTHFMKTLEDGAGTTEKTYKATLQNLSGFTDIAKSAFQELQLSVFDTFASPLMELVGGADGTGGITGFLNGLTQTIQIASEQISANIGGSLSGLYAMVQDNQGKIAGQLVVFMELTITVVSTFIEWLPIIMKVGKALVALWLVAKLQAFIVGLVSVGASILSLIPAYAGATVAAEGFAAALALTNPVGWAVLVGVAVVALLAWTVGMQDAGRRAETYTRQMNAVTEATKQFKDAQNRSTDDQSKNSKILFSNIRTQLDAVGDLDNAIENQLNTVERMTQSQLTQAVAMGTGF